MHFFASIITLHRSEDLVLKRMILLNLLLPTWIKMFYHMRKGGSGMLVINN